MPRTFMINDIASEYPRTETQTQDNTRASPVYGAVSEKVLANCVKKPPKSEYPGSRPNVWVCLEVFFLAEVRVQEGEPLENALRRFKRKVQTEDIIKEVKRHSFYLKPGEKRRVKEALARKRNRKKIRKEQD